jgi:hypothetical protein
MAKYQGTVTRYTVAIDAPAGATSRTNALYLTGDFGTAFLNFVPAGQALGKNQKRPNTNVFDIWFWDHMWPAMIDMLRNEGPVFFYYDDSYNGALFKTAPEPVGEGEPVPG